MKLTAESTVFNDNAVQKKFSELIVDADGIRTEVGKKVGNEEIISRINQSAESIKIQADKVNIEGATIFSSGRLSTDSLNNAYDSKGSATDAVDGLTSDLASVSGTTVINGAHIVTGTLDANAVNANSGKFDVANIPDLTADKITSGTIQIGVLPEDVKNSNINIGGRNLFVTKNYITANCSYIDHTLTNTVTDSKTVFHCYVQIYNGSTYEAALYSAAGTSETGKKVVTFKSPRAVPAGRKLRFKHNGSTRDILVDFILSEDIANGEDLTISYMVKGANPSVVGGLIVKDIQLEKGNKATDWSLAPEDAEATATNYISATSSGIRIASANPATQNQRIELTSGQVSFFDSNNNNRLYMTQSNVVAGLLSGAHSVFNDSGLYMYDANNKRRSDVTASGLNVYDTDGTTSVASFGSTARIGKVESANTGNVFVDNDSVDIRKGSTVLSTFTAIGAELGKNSSTATIKLCNNTVTMEGYSWDGLGSLAITCNGEIHLATGASEIQLHLNEAMIGTQGDNTESCFINCYAMDETGETGIMVYCDNFELDGEYWHMEGAPKTGSQTYNAVWTKSDTDYRLGRPSSSSRRYKEDIKPVENDELDPHRLYDIPVMQFKYKEGYFPQDDEYENNRTDVVGFIAEDVLEHYPQAAIIIDEEVDNWNERYIIPPMLKLIQEQNDRITELERRMS